jgi:hypothetical protein
VRTRFGRWLLARCAPTPKCRSPVCIFVAHAPLECSRLFRFHRCCSVLHPSNTFASQSMRGCGVRLSFVVPPLLAQQTAICARCAP